MSQPPTESQAADITQLLFRSGSKQNRIRSCGAHVETLADVSILITDGDHGVADYVEDGVKFVLSANVKEGWIDTRDMRSISEKHHATLVRSSLKPGDVLVTKTGVYFGNSAVIPEGFGEANTIAHVGIIRLKDGYDENYLSTFLNSAYGYSQLRRRGMKATRPEIKLVEFADIEVPIFSDALSIQIRRVLKLAAAKRKIAQDQYRDTISTLESNLGLKDSLVPDPLFHLARVTDVDFAGRLDSEFFQGKYREAQLQLRECGATDFIPLGEMLSYLTNGHTPHRHDLSIGDVPFLTAEHVSDFNIDYRSDKRILTEHHEGELARTALKTGDVLMTIKGRVGNAALVEENSPFANINQDVALLRFDDNAPPIWYVLSFLNSRFGKLEVEKWSTGQINPFLGLYNLRQIEVPLFEKPLMQEIGNDTYSSSQIAISTREDSERLAAAARRAVEIAIEDSEAAALAYLDKKGAA